MPDTRYIATDLDGYDSHAPYALALERGDHVFRMSAFSAVHPWGTLAGKTWPCRLFEIEDTCQDRDRPQDRKHRPIREIDSWWALGPNGRDVVALLDRIDMVTEDEAAAAAWAWAMQWDTDQITEGSFRDDWGTPADDGLWASALPATNHDRHQAAALQDAEYAQRGVGWDRTGALSAAVDAARYAARRPMVYGQISPHGGNKAAALADAALAVVCRDRLRPETFRALVGPWESVAGPVPADAALPETITAWPSEPLEIARLQQWTWADQHGRVWYMHQDGQWLCHSDPDVLSGPDGLPTDGPWTRAEAAA